MHMGTHMFEAPERNPLRVLSRITRPYRSRHLHPCREAREEARCVHSQTLCPEVGGEGVEAGQHCDTKQAEGEGKHASESRD